MSVYQRQIDSAWKNIKKKGGAIDVLKPNSVSYQGGGDTITHIQGQLNADIGIADTSMVLKNVSHGTFPSKGITQIESELIKYTTATGATLVTLSNLTRGYNNTTADVHFLDTTAELLYDMFESFGVFSEWTSQEMLEHNIQMTDKKILISGKNSTFDIETNILIISDSQYNVIDSKILSPDNLSRIMFTAQARP